MQFNELSTFIHLVETQSFTKTAIKLKVTQATVSRRIKELESSLGLHLVKRNTRNIEITPIGEKLYHGIKTQEENLSNLVYNLKKKNGKVEGTLRISLAHVISHVFISPRIGEFMQANPGINLEISYQNHEVDLVKGHFDLALISHIPKQQTTLIKLMHKIQVGLFCSPKYIEQHGEPKTIKDLENHLFTGWINDDYSVRKHIIITNIETQESQSTESISRLRINSSMHGPQLAKDGHVIIGTGAVLIQKEIARGELVRVLPNYSFGEIPFYIISLPNSKNALIEVFMKFLEECFTSINI